MEDYLRVFNFLIGFAYGFVGLTYGQYKAQKYKKFKWLFIVLLNWWFFPITMIYNKIKYGKI